MSVNAGHATKVLTCNIRIDGRTKRIRLTADGRVVLANLLPGYFALIADFMARDAHDAP